MLYLITSINIAQSNAKNSVVLFTRILILYVREKDKNRIGSAMNECLKHYCIHVVMWQHNVYYVCVTLSVTHT